MNYIFLKVIDVWTQRSMPRFHDALDEPQRNEMYFLNDFKT